jgi:hypothetical protein
MDGRPTTGRKPGASGVIAQRDPVAARLCNVQAMAQ